ncbi:MAG: flagellar biosynthetic protein FliO [Fimbriiglobus sp.]|jgi:flagellar biogenesis protein FliO|nr:flagellar biosynthetic protein FliO [Fimbriiglobus sp.]
MTPVPTGQPSVRFKWLAGGGFVVVCLGLFAPKLLNFTPNSAPTDSSMSAFDPAALPADASLGWTVAKMAVGVGLVAVACIAVARYVNRKNPPTPVTSLEVLASLPVDARCVVHLVRVADRRMLIGVDGTGVKAVAELPASVPLPAPQVIGPVSVNATSAPLPADLAALFAGLVAREPRPPVVRG